MHLECIPLNNIFPKSQSIYFYRKQLQSLDSKYSPEKKSVFSFFFPLPPKALTSVLNVFINNMLTDYISELVHHLEQHYEKVGLHLIRNFYLTSEECF